MVDTIKAVNRIMKVKGNLLKIRFEVNGKKMEAFVPDDQLFGAIKDILLNREYEYLPDFELSNFRGKVVVDVGAHVGLYSLVASVFAKKVISIEPHPINFHILKINKTINGSENIVLLNRALWSNKTTLKLHEGDHSGAHSVFQIFSRWYHVQTLTLEELVDKLNTIDLLKIDIEGSEFEVFRNLNATVLKNVNNICMEVHLRYGDIGVIKDLLVSSGFKVKLFHSPLVKKNASYSIKLKDFVTLKTIRRIVYTLSGIMGKKDETLVVLFAER